ncbi:protein YgfX [Uliginosibacterium aquaticum]|uniref:Toxin CptA n=1 Tax=Uliginosibacterium aquaticum TaxID=2731212 RepID=A0ABX2IL87_9RHOO|nr:protein YgfX [Uliginosibacterium aquaticum]NSL56653.1 hypothetical protein [Uliginosibacterium aquaticum]
MSAPFFLPLRLSRVLLGTIILVHGLPLACVLAPEVPRPLSIAVTLAVVLSALWQMRQWQRIAACVLQMSGEACWLERGDSRVQVELLSDSRDLGWLIVLVWRELESGRCGRAALTRDGLPAEDWRALRRYLRWQLSDTQPG